ncbi:hypothetical protein [Microbacterium gorillae]|uniref:hypothetical protein n=1 Tax=Microbacterium gorillae TaxID=1231063 RepID=UPI00058B5053|nr:hypothetical protein [Microbacterium gorillae]
MRRSASRRAPLNAVVIIPAALALFSAFVVVLTIRTIGFAVLFGIAVFLVSFALTLLLDRLIARGPAREAAVRRSRR